MITDTYAHTKLLTHKHGNKDNNQDDFNKLKDNNEHVKTNIKYVMNIAYSFLLWGEVEQSMVDEFYMTLQQKSITPPQPKQSFIFLIQRQ